MKQYHTFLTVLFFVFAAGTVAGVSNSDMFEPGKGRDDVNVAVLPTQVENAGDIPWAASVLPNQITDLLNRFTAVKLLSRNESILNQIQQELQFQLTHGSETGSPSIGEFTNGDYFITSRISKTGRSIYNLYLEFIQLQQEEDGSLSPAIIAVSNGEYSLNDIRENAVKIALAGMFSDMGVILTDAGNTALLAGIEVNKVQARTAVAQAEDADFEGNSFDALFYKNKARQLDSSLGKLKKTSSEDELLGVGTGTAIADDATAQRKWNNNIISMEKLFVDHPPFEIYYTPNPKQFGKTSYETQTASLEFSVSFRRGVDFKVSQAMLDDVAGGLRKTGNQEKWGFTGWPQKPIPAIFNSEKVPHFEGLREYLITAELVDNLEKTIQVQTFTLQSQLLLNRGKIGADSTQRLRVVFPNVPVENTSNTHVKIVSINGYPVINMDRDAEAAANFINVVAVKKLPMRQRPGISKDERRVAVIAQFPAFVPPPLRAEQVPEAVQTGAALAGTALTAEQAAEQALAGMDAALAGGPVSGEEVPLTPAELAAKRQDQAAQEELARRQQELAKQQEEYNKQQAYIKEQEEIERQKNELERQKKQEEAAALQRQKDLEEQAKQEKKDKRKARRDAVPLHNRFGLGVAVLSDLKNFNMLTMKGDLDIGIRNFALEGIFTCPIKQHIYDDSLQGAGDSSFVYGFGGGMGYTFYSNYFLGTLTVGIHHMSFMDKKSINTLYSQLKLDLVPFKKGIALRLGLLLEGAGDSWGDTYKRYFDDRWAFKAGSFLLYHRFQAGLVVWI
jgi:hypothetical protein